MTVTAPAFAHKLPPKEPTLRELAEAAVCAAVSFNSYDAGDAEWDRRDAAAIEASAAFHAKLSEVGIDKPLLDALLNTGVIF